MTEPTRLEVAVDALQRIEQEAAYLEEAGGDGAVIRAWAREALAKVGTPPIPSNAPSSAWMEAIAREAATLAIRKNRGALWRKAEPGWFLGQAAQAAVDEAVTEALKTPPPSGPGGPNERPADG